MIKQTFSEKAIKQLEEYIRYYDRLWRNKTSEEKEFNETKEKKFYPAVVVCCEYQSLCCSGRSLKANAKTRSIKTTPVNSFLMNSLENIAKKYEQKVFQRTKVDDTKVFIGTCAEDDACNMVLNKLKSGTLSKLTDLSFTPAVRPRTRQHIDYCKVCNEIFGSGSEE